MNLKTALVILKSIGVTLIHVSLIYAIFNYGIKPVFKTGDMSILGASAIALWYELFVIGMRR